MVKKVRRYIRENCMLEQGDKLVLGVSGGADSVCLFMLLKCLQDEYGLSLYVVHVNHGIRTEAAKDADYVKKLCEAYEVPFYLFEEDVPKWSEEWGMSEEETGRKIRYRCFLQVAQKVGAGKIAMAHHLGDQAETVLFHLIRGTNLSGMVGIRPVTEWKDGLEHIAAGEGKTIVIRPLLCVTKGEITGYLRKQKVSWREDMTNQDNIYTRNKLRNQILPQLCEINEGAVEHIAEFAQCAMEQQVFFDKMVQRFMAEHVKKYEETVEETECEKGGMAGFSYRENPVVSYMVNRKLLLSQEPVLSRAVIYEMIAGVCGSRQDLTKEHVAAVYGLLDSQSGRKITLPYGAEAKISYENVIIRKCSNVDNESAFKEQRIDIYKETNIYLPDGRILAVKMINREDVSDKEWENLRNKAVNPKNNYTKLFDCDTIKDTLYARNPEKEDYFIINEAGNRKKLSRYFIDCKIPEEARRESIVVAMDHEVLWLLCGRRCENHRIKDGTKQILIISCEGENNGEAY